MEINGREYETTLLEGSEGPGRFWGPGHVETKEGGGRFTFADVKAAEKRPEPTRK